MALIKVKDLLKHAEENGYGVPAINVFDYNSIKFAVMAAEEAPDCTGQVTFVV